LKREEIEQFIESYVEASEILLADDFDEAEQAAMREVVNLVGGTNPRVVSAMEGTTDWPMDKEIDT